MKNLIVLCAAICLAFVSVSTAQKKTAAKPFTTSGYFNGIEMTSKESGDYGGTSIFLTESDEQMFALVMIAEGVPLTPILVEVKVSGKDMRTVEFTLPNENGDRKFKGTVSANALTLNESGTKSVLKRECGFVSSDIKKVVTGEGEYHNGKEMFIYDAGGTWYALVKIAEGLIMSPVLVELDAKLKNYALDTFTFTLPNDNGRRKFTGKVTKTGITLDELGNKSILKDKCYK